MKARTAPPPPVDPLWLTCDPYAGCPGLHPVVRGTRNEATDVAFFRLFWRRMRPSIYTTELAAAAASASTPERNTR